MLNDIIGINNLNRLIEQSQKVTGWNLYSFNKYLGQPAKIDYSKSKHNYDLIYFPSCVTRMMGKPGNEKIDQIQVIMEVASKAGYNLLIPDNINDFCCGTTFSSKGFTRAFDLSINKTLEMLWKISDTGIIPIIFDSTSCTYTMLSSEKNLTDVNKSKFQKMKIMDSIEFASNYIIPKIKINKISDKIILHNTCSALKLNLTEKMRSTVLNISDNVPELQINGCCGFAGDRGFLYPELTSSATKAEVNEINQFNVINDNHFYSSNIPCEIGMSNTIDKQYLSIFYLIYKQMI